MTRTSNRWQRHLTAATAAVAVAGAIGLSLPASAQAATMVGRDVNVYGYCRWLGYSNATATNPASPYSWYCVTNGGARRLGGGDMSVACKLRFGNRAYALLVANNAWGWACFV